MKYIIKQTFIILSISLLLSSCSDWLDVNPSDQTSAKDLFSTEEGFHEALTGVYTLMTKPALYGKEMTYGFVDVIGQQWALSSTSSVNNPTYFYAKQYDYENESTYRLIEAIWANQYNAIANLNSILEHIDDQKSVFENEISYSLTKGEALGLRAFLHFDLLRLFAPNDFTEGSNNKYIPYVDLLTKKLSPSLTTQEFVEKCIEDLESSIDLLEVDPILTETGISNNYFINRTVHFNFFAAKALLARIHLYVGNNEKALEEAMDVIDAQNENRFRWVSLDEATAGNEVNMNYTYSSEHIFSLNVRKLEEYSNTSFGTESINALINRKYNKSANTLFADEMNDYRTRLYSTWNGFETQFSKYKPVGKGTRLVPLIKISEMYYIAAESLNSSESIDLLNEVLINRGLNKDILPDQLDEEIYKEYQKEFTGEGQLFFFYKRNNISVEGAGDNYNPVLPLPRNEIDLGSR